MEFGKLQNVDLVDWSVAKDDPGNLAYIQSVAAVSTDFRVGAPAWGCKAWLGNLYPPGTAAGEFLYHYAREFNCIELNTTYYRGLNSAQIERWVSQVPADFIFCPKINKAISHERSGLRDSTSLREWLSALPSFGAHLGPSFLQLPPHFRYADKAELFPFLKAWPAEFPLTLEFRHESWFSNGSLPPALVDYLRGRGIGLMITDVAGRRDVAHATVTSPFVFLRFIGNALHASDYSRSLEWARRLSAWTRAGIPRVFFIVHEPDDVTTPVMARQVTRDLNEVCGARLVGPRNLSLLGD